MISNEDLKQELEKNEEIDWVTVEGDGYHYHLTVVSEAFLGKSLVARQQWVYRQLNTFITNGQLHAVTMKTFTKEEWEMQHG